MIIKTNDQAQIKMGNLFFEMSLVFYEINRLKNLKAYVLIFVGSEIKVVKECKALNCV